MNISGENYKRAFEAYLRRGTPIELSLKRSHPTTHYIWRTRKDRKVRSNHAANDGKVFAWNNPPTTGHPGEGYGCRCTAEPYMSRTSEHLELLLSDVNDTGSQWSSEEFVNHYRTGNGRAVTLREIGHLIRVVNRYMSLVENKLKRQIADKARQNVGKYFNYPFVNTYQMQNDVFSIGDTTIGGLFYGTSKIQNALISIEGDLNFFITDEFADPMDIGIELPGSNIYSIMDKWTGILEGRIFMDRSRSIYRSD